jgi:hypothetical protein
MARRRLSRIVGAGIILAGVGTVAMSTTSSGQTAATCTSTTVTFVQAVGFPSAPVLVPMNLPVTLCTISRHAVVIRPGFQTVGAPSAPVIVPAPLQLVACPSGVLPASNASGNSQICLLSP